jgi:tetratricopeptide (TPR) repeat protein
LAATFGGGEGEPIERTELFSAWRSAVELAANERPLVVVVEDLHWSSDSLLDLIDVVLQPRGDAPLLMIVLARPELLDRRPTWGGGRRNYVSVALEPLDDPAIGALVDFLLRSPPPEVVQTVVARAEGNPFYAGELARTISERAPSLDDPAAVRAVITALPDTVHATVLSRLDLLPTAARHLIQVGAVFGRSFSVAGVAALAPEMADEMPEAVEHLLEHDLIRVSEGDQLTFRHILIREVGYNTLPRVERARLHGAAGTWLASEAAGREEEQAELVAFHFREAITLANAAGAEVDPAQRESAVAWLHRAADAAVAGAAHGEAARHLRAAIDLAPREQLPELWADLGDIYLFGSPAIEAYATAARLGRELGRPADFVLRAMSGQLMVLGRWSGSVGTPAEEEEIRSLLDDVRATRAVASDRRAIGSSLVAESFLPIREITGGATLYSSIDLASAREHAQQAAAIARELDDPELLSAALDSLSALTLGADSMAGLELSRERVAIEHRLSLIERIDAHNMVAWHSAALGELEDAFHAAESVMRDLAPMQAQELGLTLAAWQVWALARLGRWDELTSGAERAIRMWDEAGRPSSGYAIHGYMAAAEVGRARGDDRLTDRATQVVRGISEQFPPGQPFGRLSAFLVPDPEALVESVILRWEPYITRLHMVELVVSVCVDYGQRIPLEPLDNLLVAARSRGQLLLTAQLLRARGVQQSAPDDLREALAAYRRFKARPLAARVEVELGQLVGDAGMVASGTATLEALGDVAQLARIAAVAR